MLINRRQMLAGLGSATFMPLFLHAMRAEAASASNTICVVIFLTGGNDGLNTVIPIRQYGAYYQLRTPKAPPPGAAMAYSMAQLAPTAFDPNPATQANAATQFAFNPDMPELRSLYATGKLAVVAGVGFPAQENNPQSHPNAVADWNTGQININSASPDMAGWLRQALAGQAAGSLGPTASLNGPAKVVSAPGGITLIINGSLEHFRAELGVSDNAATLAAASQAFNALPATSPAGQFTQSIAAYDAPAAASVAAIAASLPLADYPVVNPRKVKALDVQLKSVAQLILGGAGIRGYAVATASDFDTHADQNVGDRHGQLLGQVSKAMSDFYTYLKANGVSRNVVVMTASDFGRTAGVNANWGTDHGTASVSFILGDLVRGGVYGNYPSLTNLDARGNLKVQVDFRNVISDMVGAMGGNPAAILGQSWPKLGFI